MTNIKHKSITLFSVFTILLLPVGCSEYWQANKAEVAKAFVQAVNQNDTDTIVKLSTVPLSVRNQTWETAPDGKGFLLGKSKDEYLADKTQIKAFFSDNIKNISIEGTKPVSSILPPHIQNELHGIEKRWQGLDIYLYQRGMADVEHIFVIGINTKSKVAAIYFN